MNNRALRDLSKWNSILEEVSTGAAKVKLNSNVDLKVICASVDGIDSIVTIAKK